MPIDFHLSLSEAGIRTAAAGFAQQVLKPSRAEYLKYNQSHERFQATQPTYAAATKGGLIKGQVSPRLGGSGGSLIEAAIMVEECYAVEPSTALTIFATGLGLTPLNIAGKPEHAEFLAPFLSGEGAPLASLVFSEPGGVANAWEKGAPGLQTTARREGDEWIINGEKKWATNCAGWDFKGCDLACVVCRDVTEPAEPGSDPKDRAMVILVTRADLDRNGPDAFRVLRHIPTPGHTSVSGPHVRYTNVRVPAKNVLSPPGQGAQLALASFDASAVLVGAMGVGLMRAAFDAALDFAKRDNRNGAVPLLGRQAFADLLSGIKMQTEASRALTWKAAHAMENGPGDYDARRELALAAKVYCSDAAVKACTDAINAVGITAYDSDQPFAELLNNAMVLPIFDGGNVGIRRRHMQELMLSPDYDAWASTYGPTEKR
ncbi:acyl-CoA dehydrogenase NM domain-like protein [Hypoxylon trugodes]|uniref:acyl-CoA dehydrogenase NM domain-like protein n=1 Tax=Hypoxylon trugodes TaxID=326681 RepID=UPI002195B83C|nr:acyl-CoA dehydrogenase NM domain-like protein [Hypoxylon trugodes]KAI1386141.1 acyl-CoA dehydrogenase NM domain-like protein [Hypoxylon trugodes]